MTFIGLPWYTLLGFKAAMNVMADRILLMPSYDSWLRDANRRAVYEQARGHRIVRAFIEARHFAHWCAANGQSCNETSRQDFARGTAMLREARLSA